MNNLMHDLEEVHGKLAQIIAQNSKLKVENSQLHQLKKVYEQTIDEQTKRLANTGEPVGKTKKNNLSNKENKDLKLRISELIKEVDKCMGLLNI